MKAPDFWWRPPGLAAGLLAPAGLLYAAIADRRLTRQGERAPCPVVCVGNMTVGGSGKTPTALALARALAQAGRRPAFLTRGYRGRLHGPVLVDASRHDVRDVGDEALLLAGAFPTAVARDRRAGAGLAHGSGADVIVMDDGLQNPSLVKDFALAVFDGATGIGNGRVLPAGPLRASSDAQWPRVDAVLVIGQGEAGDAIARDATRRRVPVHRARAVPDPEVAAGLPGRRVLAFAGIGRPAKFYDTLRQCGAEVAATRSFPDHHAFSVREIRALLDDAERRGLLPVTTAKDAARLSALAAREPRLGRIATLPISIGFDDSAGLLGQIEEALGPAGGRQPSPVGCGSPSRVSTALGDT